MREILFRGFHKDENGKQKVFVNGEWIKGEWVYGYPVIDTGDCSLKAEGKCFCPHDGTSIFFWDDDFHEYTDCEIVPETVGQYTGLTDKNGAKIFEGDIVKDEQPQLFGKVVYATAADGYDGMSGFMVDDIYDGMQNYNGFWHLVEIIGNIYDNPELLEGVRNEVNNNESN